jgi:mRNA interferase MazF
LGKYVPEKGDFVAVRFSPQSGHEQKGRRPALIISRTEFNRRTGMAFACPITSRDRGFPFHVPVEEEAEVSGVIMVEQIKSIDFRARNVRYIGTASSDTLEKVLALLDACLY